MKYCLEIILTEIAVAAQKALAVNELPIVEFANPKFDADFAIPCFLFARDLGKSPQVIAQQLSLVLTHAAIKKIEPQAGFVNIWLEPAVLAAGLDRDFKAVDGYGESDLHKGQTALVEFPSPNMAKPFSVGHLRPANQGWALTQLMKAVGYRVVTDNHIGDWGTPFGKWVIGFKTYSSDEQLKSNGVYELARIYIKITADLKAEKDAGRNIIAEEVQSWLLKLEQGDAEAVAYSQTFSKISIEHMHQIMQRLNITTDYEYGEASYIKEGKRMVEELVEQGRAERQADGSVVVWLHDYKIDTPILLEKSNGAALYATSDLATLKFRQEKWNPDKVIYVVAAEQQFHFKQLFALADMLGYKKEYVHYWFGLINQINDDGTRSKMSSRKGVILLEDLLDMAEQKARQKAVDGDNLSDKAVSQIALGAIKFTDFSQDKKTSILFDWERIFSMQGFSGPYVQYAAVRVGSILSRFEYADWQENDYDWQAEREMLLQLARYPQVVVDAAEFYEPHRIAQYLYDLARIFNRYYETTSVADAAIDLRNLRLWLLKNVRNNFEHAFGLLGIEVPEKM